MRSIIVGAGPAGVVAAETIRNLDPDHHIVVLSAEPYPPYSPPAMADHFLTGSQAHLWRGTEWPRQLDIEHRSSVRVVAVEPGAHRVRTSDGTDHEYDRLLMASGARLFAPVPGVALDGVCNFKSLGSALQLVQLVRKGAAKRVVIVGAGFIGVEIALLLRELGVEVVQVEILGQIMNHMLDETTAAEAQRLLVSRGVDLRLDTEAVAIVGNGRAQRVVLESGDELSADLFIAATGVRPNVEMLSDSGIACNWGVMVDDHMRTGDDNVFAAGDVAEPTDRLTGERCTHAIFPNAVEQGRVAALNMLGRDTVYEGAERFNSLKHLGVPIVAGGLKDGDERLHARGADWLRTMYLRDGRLVGFQLVGSLRTAGVLRTLVNRAFDVGQLKDRLLDPGFGWGAAMTRLLPQV